MTENRKMAENISIPFRLLGGIILLEAEADGIQGMFAFDTGSEVSTINSRYYAPQTGTTRDVTTYSDGIKTRNITEGLVSCLALPHITLTDHPICFLDLSYVENSLRQLDENLRFLGTIGMDIISRYPVRMDYQNQCITFNPAKPFAKSCTVHFETDKGMILLSGTLGGTDAAAGNQSYRFLLDTGANTCLIGEKLRTCGQVTDSGQKITPFLLPTLCFGGQRYHNIAAVSANIQEIKKISVDAIIGFQILEKQRAEIDFTENVVRFEQG